MDYPDNFDTPTFPAGREIALTRWLAIGISVALMLVAVAGGLIFWAARSARVEPFLISVDKTTGLWSIVGHHHMREMPAVRTMQESVVAKFAVNWFSISATESENTARWQSCDATTCASDEYIARSDRMCAISCATSGELFNRFIYDVVPDYTARVAAGETWRIDMDTLIITPDGEITERGGAWRISAQITSNLVGTIDVLAFATTAREVGSYPATLGFYVQDFNAYRMNK